MKDLAGGLGDLANRMEGIEKRVEELAQLGVPSTVAEAPTTRAAGDPGKKIISKELFTDDEAKKHIGVIADDWLRNIHPHSVTRGPKSEKSLPFVHILPGLTEVEEVRWHMKHALFRNMGLPESGEEHDDYLKAYTEAYKIRVKVNRSKKVDKNMDEMAGAGIHQRFLKMRRSVKSNKITRTVKEFVIASGLSGSLSFDSEWRKPDQTATKGCYFFQDISAEYLFDAVFGNPTLDGFKRVVSLRQIASLDQLVSAKLAGKSIENHDTGTNEKTKVMSDEIVALVEDRKQDIHSLDSHGGHVCECCYLIELGGYPGGSAAVQTGEQVASSVGTVVPVIPVVPEQPEQEKDNLEKEKGNVEEEEGNVEEEESASESRRGDEKVNEIDEESASGELDEDDARESDEDVADDNADEDGDTD